MPRRPDFSPTSLPSDMQGEPLIRELNRRFGLIGQAFAFFAPPFVLTYANPVVIDGRASTYFTIVVTTGGAFTVNFPTNLTPGQPVALHFANVSGGAMGAVTFGAGYSLAGAFVAPANGKQRVYGFAAVTVALLIEQYRSVADI